MVGLNCTNCFDNNNNQWVLDSARNVARRMSSSAWYPAGTQTFNDTFNKNISYKNQTRGSRLYDKSALFHIEGQYNWDFLKLLDIITGTSYRLYIPNSAGTALQDTSGRKIMVHDVGAYFQATKRLFNDHFKITGSVRGDKNSNFPIMISARGALVYTYRSKNSQHTFRIAASSGFRTPTLQEQYAYLNTGYMKLVGNLSGQNNLYTLNSVNDALNILYQLPPSAGNVAVAQAALVPVSLSPLKPEQLTSFEFGYRSNIANKVYIDLTAYYSIYRNFIGYTRVANPNKDTITNGVAGQQSGADNVTAGIYTPYQTWVNAGELVPSWGAAISIAYYVGRGITPYVNYTYADVDDKNQANNSLIILSGFNTPKHKVNVGLNANKVWKGLGLTLNWKWVASYQWNSPFASGRVPAFHTLDMQLFYEVEKAYSTIRIGASNLYNNQHIEIAGGPRIGALYYVGWLFDFNKAGRKNKTGS